MRALSLLRVLAGIVFLILGVLGLFLPILQGLLFLAIGFLLLSVDIPVFRRVSIWIQKKFPRLRHPLMRVRSWIGARRKKSSKDQQNPSSIR